MKEDTTKPISTLIFDLSEVLISGIIGVEEYLADRVQMPAAEVLAAFRCELLDELCCGLVSEDAYVSYVLQRHRWAIPSDELKALIRRNFHRKVPGMDDVLASLISHYQLVLLSDNACEWVSYIEEVPPFLRTSDPRFFSYQLGQVKRDSSTFTKVLAGVGRSAGECVFIDDNHANVSAAARAGLRGLVFSGSAQLSKDLSTLNLIPASREYRNVSSSTRK